MYNIIITMQNDYSEQPSPPFDSDMQVGGKRIRDSIEHAKSCIAAIRDDLSARSRVALVNLPEGMDGTYEVGLTDDGREWESISLHIRSSYLQ
jgi:hypothetical protein